MKNLKDTKNTTQEQATQEQATQEQATQEQATQEQATQEQASNFSLSIADTKNGWDIVKDAFNFKGIDTAQKAVNAIKLIGTLDEISKYNACKIAQKFYKNVEWRNWEGKTYSYDSFMLKAFGIKKQLAYNMNSVAFLIDDDGISLVELLTGIKVTYSYLLELATYLKRQKNESEKDFTTRASTLILELDIKDSNLERLKNKLKARKDLLSGKDLTPLTDKPNADKPNADKPNADKPNADKPNADKPNADKPNADKPNADKPNADEKQADKTLAEKLLVLVEIYSLRDVIDTLNVIADTINDTTTSV